MPAVDPVSNNLNTLLGGLPAGEVEKAAAAKSGTYFDKEMFLKLLVAQLKYQNPSSPMDQSEFMNQAAVLANVEQMQQVATSAAETASWQRSLAAAAMVGKQVTGMAPDGTVVTGVVERVTLTASEASVVVNGTTVPMKSITSVEPAASA